MPFDSLPENGRHNLVRLRDHLSAPLPTAFKWDYGYVLHENACGSAGCALGLAMVMMPDFRPTFNSIHDTTAASYFGISDTEFQYIFLYVPLGKRVEDVTPAEVARRIDEVLFGYEMVAHLQASEVQPSGERRLGGPERAGRMLQLV